MLDRRGQVAFTNDFASAILRARELLQERGGALRAGSQAVTTALQAAISKALAPPSAPAPRTRNVVLLPRVGRMPVVTMTAPLVATANTDMGALVLIHDPEATASPASNLLSQMFNLTPAEAAVAAAVLDGRSLRDIARQRDTSLNTVRSLLYRVLAKTGTQRQSELMRLAGPLRNLHALSASFVAALSADPISFDERHLTNAGTPLRKPLRVEAQGNANLRTATVFEFAPGAATSKHYANGHELVYVLEGALAMDIDGEATKVFGPGEIAYVGPGVVHRGRNASEEKKLMGLLVLVEHGGKLHKVNV